jgi:ketosteroid isomerase-like protein
MSHGKGATVNDEQKIRELIESWAGAVRHQDLNGIVAAHAADLVMFDVPPPVALRGMPFTNPTTEPL